MKSFLHAAGAIALLSFAALCLILSWVAHQVSHQVENLRLDVNAQLTAARTDAARQVEAARKDLLIRSERQIKAARSDLMSFVEHSAEIVNNRAGEALATVHTGMALANAQINGIREDVRPTLEHTASITARADGAAEILFRRDALPAQLLGITAAAKVTLGETAQTMRTIRLEAPLITANIRRATDETALSAQQTRIAMGNFAEATRPLPKWLRYPLSLTGAIAPTVAGAVGAAAATGAFR